MWCRSKKKWTRRHTYAESASQIRVARLQAELKESKETFRYMENIIKQLEEELG